MKVLYVAAKFNEDGIEDHYREYTYMTTETHLEVDDPLVTETGDIVYFSQYVDKPDFKCRWIIGDVDIGGMKLTHGARLWDNGINPSTGEPYKSKNWKDWESEENG